MKKYLLISFLFLICVPFTYAQDTSRFVEAFKNCSSYSEIGTVNTEGMNVKSKKSIIGKQNEKCIYEENVEFANNNFTIMCSFSPDQVKEITNVMSAYELVQSYSNEKVDTSSYSAVQNNPVVKVWSKYLQNSSVCSFK